MSCSRIFLSAALAATLCVSATTIQASSHREAPAILGTPQVDATDFYMFRSYEQGRENYVTLVANYNPLQDAYDGPNYFPLDTDAQYRINIDNTGDGSADLAFEFRIHHDLRDIKIPVGAESVSIPLRNVGPVTADPATQANLNVLESYSVKLIRRPGANAFLINADTGEPSFGKPMDNIGEKSFPNYRAYASGFFHTAQIPECGDGRVFVGQRKDSFAINLGEVFDLVNIANPVGQDNVEVDDLADANVTSFVLEVPIDCLTQGGTDTIGAWTSARLPKVRTLRSVQGFDARDAVSANFKQVSRLGMPLVNELVIGLKDKNIFNASKPTGDLRFATYVTNPTLPELLEILFGVEAPNNFPRTDLLATFITGIGGLNEFGFGEMQRLNTTIPPTEKSAQSRMGVLGGDLAGFPNGRRPGDDVVDITLQVAMGVLCHAFPGVYCDPADAPAGLLPFTDGARQRP